MKKSDLATEQVLVAEIPRKDPYVSVYAQVAKSVAGCIVCERPIVKGSTRLSVVVTLPEPRVNRDGSTRRTERYNIHPGCLTAALEGGDELITGWHCWDCGAEPPFKQGHPWKCFSTSRFAFGALCVECSQRSRWRVCEICLVFFPHYMVSRIVAGELEGESACEYCAARNDAKTLFQLRHEKEEFEALRARVAAGKVFGR